MQVLQDEGRNGMRKQGSEEKDRPRFHIPPIQLSASLSSAYGAGADLLDLEVDENSPGFNCSPDPIVV